MRKRVLLVFGYLLLYFLITRTSVSMFTPLQLGAMLLTAVSISQLCCQRDYPLNVTVCFVWFSLDKVISLLTNVLLVSLSEALNRKVEPDI